MAEHSNKTLLKKIVQAEAELKVAEMDTIVWGQDKYKNFSLFELSEFWVNNRKKHLNKLYQELKNEGV